MDNQQKQPETDFNNETVFCTPEPRASSTVQRPQIARQFKLHKLPLNYLNETSADSLGILSLNNFSLASTDAPNQSQVTNEKLKKQRDLVNSMFQKTMKNYNLPSQYLKASESIKFDISASNTGRDSTVNESDLVQLKSKIEPSRNPEKITFAPNDISTPRSSCASDEGNSPRMSIESLSQEILSFSQKLRNSDIELSDLRAQIKNLDNESFASGELAAAKLDAYEQSWRNERDTLGGNSRKGDSMFSQIEISNVGTQDGISVTEFFRKKSELADLCLKDSPEKDTLPIPLINKSEMQETLPTLSNASKQSISPVTDLQQILSDECDFSQFSNTFGDSALDLSEIERVISANDNTTKIMDYMFGKSEKPTKQKEDPQRHSYKSRRSSLQSKNQVHHSKENRYTYEGSTINFDSEKVGKSTEDLQPRNYRSTSTELQNKKRYSLKENRNFCNDPCNSYKRSSSIKPLKDSGNNMSDKSLGSLRTVSSLDSLPGGKLPLETNKIELVWGSVPVGSKKTQMFMLRNRSQNKLKLYLSSSSPNFKLLKDHSEADPMQILTVLLHPTESRSFSVMFSPSTVGAMAERITFSPLSTELQSKQTTRQQLNLFGYGGYSLVDILDVPKDINLKMWLSLGKLTDLPELEKGFLLRNKGSLPAFVYLNFGSKALYRNSQTVNVYPTEIILKPREEKTVKVIYTPTKDELSHVLAMTKNPVIEIGYIQIISGEEPLRGRIRRLCKKLKNEAGSVNVPLIESLSNTFPNEKMPNDIKKLTETVGSVKELMQNLVSREITLTLERGVEENIAEGIVGIEDTTMFHSLVEGQPTMFLNTTHTNACIVEPTNIILTLPTKTEDNVLVINQTSQSLQFQTALTNNEILEVSPCEGILSPNETILLKISCDTKQFKQQQQKLFKLSIYVDDDVFDVDIKIILIKPRT